MHEQIIIAKTIATIAHRGQVDKSSQPYIGHPARVAARLDKNDWITVSAAWLHDVVEDTGVTLEELRAAGVDQFVLNLVSTLTRELGEKYIDYLGRIKKDPIATRIKAADIADNTDISRLALLPEAEQIRLIKKYADARRVLGVKEVEL